jgi:hypothetical protein
MFCRKCGQQFDNSLSFCPACHEPAANVTVSNSVSDVTPQFVQQPPVYAQPGAFYQPPIPQAKKSFFKSLNIKKIAIIAIPIILLLIVIVSILGGEVTIADYYDDLVSLEQYGGYMSAETYEFISNNEYLFPHYGGRENLSSITDWTITVDDIFKNVAKYDTSIVFADGEVVEIVESEDGTSTYIHIAVGNEFKHLVGVYLKDMPGIYEGDRIMVYFLPIDVVRFDNIGGGTTVAIYAAFCYYDDNFSGGI